jgi:hypothetical protein
MMPVPGQPLVLEETNTFQQFASYPAIRLPFYLIKKLKDSR